MEGNLCWEMEAAVKSLIVVVCGPLTRRLGHSHPAILTPTEMSQTTILKVRNGEEPSICSPGECPGMGGQSLTDHMIGNVDLDLSLILEGHLALDTLVRLFLFGNKRKNQVSRDRKPCPQKPGSRCPRVAWPLPGIPIHSLPTSLPNSTSPRHRLPSKGLLPC